MKTTDLMVGDWVFNKFLNKNIKITPYDFFSKYPKVIEGNDLEPIPLTVEIMKANGYDFMDCYINYIYDDDEVSYLEMTLNDDDEFVWTINTNEYDIMQIKYVHELQHALRLLGIEKEIKL